MTRATSTVIAGQSGYLLVVDDEEQNRELLRDLLEARGHKVTEAENGKRALQMVIKDPPDVILLDVLMPEMDGFEVCHRLKANEDTAPIPVIMVTSLTERKDRLAGIEAGATDFISKPIDSQEVILRVRNAVYTKHLFDAEKELLEKTLTGSIKILSEILSLVNPPAFSRASRIKPYVRQIATWLDLPNIWEFELAAMLSQIGCVTLPPEVLQKLQKGISLSEEEKNMFSAYPEVGGNFIRSIPRLEGIAGMIAAQQKPFHRRTIGARFKDEDRSALGGYIIQVALEFEQLLGQGLSVKEALVRLRRSRYVSEVVDPLDNLEMQLDRGVEKPLSISELGAGMIIYEDVITKDDLLLASRGDEVTDIVIRRLRNFAESIGVVEPIKVMIPATAG